jgi:hypothetical protein
LSLQLPQPAGPDWKLWGKRLVDSLSMTRSQLVYFLTGDSASIDGLLLWDRSGYPVISKSDAYNQVLLSGGCGQFYATTTQTALSADTATAVTLNSAVAADGLAIDDSDSTKIDVSEAGLLQISITAQATSGSSYTGYLWVNVNGTDGYAVKKAVNGDNTITHTALVTVSAGHYLKVMYSVSNTGLTLPNTAASSPIPAIPAVQVLITRVNQ